MANQITIDIGAAANDGTGDPLRTAFNYVNNNFSNVWNTGLPNSNVQFSDNRILTVNTNANLVLSPNGIGKVASNVDIVPNTANVFSLGSSTRRWNTVYGQYLDLSHNVTIGGNLVVTGNLTVAGPIRMAVYANATTRDAAITSPQPGMMIYVTGTGMQVRGATSWNTVAGSGT